MTRRFAILSSVGAVLFLSACQLPPGQEAALRLVAAKPGTEVEFQVISRAQVVDIHCPNGIGWAEIAIPAGAKVNPILVRLHLRGLEGFSFEHGVCRMQVSVSSHGDMTIHQLREDVEPLATKDRLAVSLVSASGGPPRIPLDGWFEIRLPESCQGHSPVRLSWVDFYR
jgi:hypothetical protein